MMLIIQDGYSHCEGPGGLDGVEELSYEDAGAL